MRLGRAALGSGNPLKAWRLFDGRFGRRPSDQPLRIQHSIAKTVRFLGIQRVRPRTIFGAQLSGTRIQSFLFEEHRPV